MAVAALVLSFQSADATERSTGSATATAGCRLKSEQIYSRAQSKIFWRLLVDVVDQTVKVDLATRLVQQHKQAGSSTQTVLLAARYLGEQLAELNKMYPEIAPSMRSRGCRRLVNRNLAQQVAAHILELNQLAKLLIATGASPPPAPPVVGATEFSDRQEALEEAREKNVFGHRLIWRKFYPTMEIDRDTSVKVKFDLWHRTTDAEFRELGGPGCPYFVVDEGAVCFGAVQE